jgi:hypothetical protein
MIVAGASKTNKSWSVSDLGLSLVSGSSWLGFKCARVPVLLVSLEIQEYFLRYRLEWISRAKEIIPERGMLRVLNLRGVRDLNSVTLVRYLLERFQPGELGAIIIDPIYKLYGNLNENDASDMAALSASFDQLADALDCGVIYVTHYSKGAQAGKDHIDRMSGSGVLHRDPDTILTLSSLEESACFRIEATTRNFEPIQPFEVEFAHLIMRRRDDLSDAPLRQPGRFAAKYEPKELVDRIANDELTYTAFWKRIKEDESTEMSEKTFKRLLKRSVQTKLIDKSPLSGLYSAHVGP